MLTPIANRLSLALQQERERLYNEWFFKWHHIGGQHTIEMDDFAGGKIIYSGLQFWGSPRQVYWATIKRYVRNKTAENLRDIESQISNFSYEKGLLILEECEQLLSGHFREVTNYAVKKDRILRGNGTDLPEEDRTPLLDISIEGNIRSQVESIRNFHFPPENKFQKIVRIAKQNKDVSPYIVLVVTVAGAVFAFIFTQMKDLIKG
ncbi:MAG: hypothetical protein ACRCWF_12860 [Beijerinckiaceae bacterium]